MEGKVEEYLENDQCEFRKQKDTQEVILELRKTD